MSEAERLAESARERLGEHKDEVLACLRRAPAELMASSASSVVSPDTLPPVGWLVVDVGSVADPRNARQVDARQAIEDRRRWAAETTWRLVEGEAMLWAAEPALEAMAESPDDRRTRAHELARAVKQARRLLAGALQKRPNGFRSETGGEFLAAWRDADPTTAAISDPVEQHEHAFRRLQQLVRDLETVEAVAAIVEANHPPRSRGRQLGDGLIPPERVRSLGWVFQSLTGCPWGRSAEFVKFVQIIGAAAVELRDDYDVGPAIKRARPDDKPPPSRAPERRRKVASA